MLKTLWKRLDMRRRSLRRVNSVGACLIKVKDADFCAFAVFAG